MRELNVGEVELVSGASMEDGAGLFLTGLAMALAPEVTIPMVIVAGAISGAGLSEMMNS